MSDTVREMREFQRKADKLLRELGLALEKALLAFQDPRPKSKPYDKRYSDLCRELDNWLKITPHAKDWVELVKRQLRKEMDSLVDRAERAHRQRGKVDGNLQRRYNQAVGGALSKAPGQVSDAAKKQLEKSVRQLLDQQLPSEVPANVRATMTRELSTWANKQPVVEDAFFVVQSAVSDVSMWLHERLTITGEIETTRVMVAQQKQISEQDAKAADQKVGALAKRSQELDKAVERRVKQNLQRVSTKASFDFDPKLVLDPSVKYLKQVETRAGIQIQSRDVKVDLRAKVQVVNPLLDSRQVNASANADVAVQNGNTLTRFGVGANATDLTGNTAVGANAYLNFDVGKNVDIRTQYSNTWKEGEGWQGHQVKATLTWRF